MSETKEARKPPDSRLPAGKRVRSRSLLGLSDEDMAVIEVKVALAKRLRAQRTRARMSQVEVARIVRSSQAARRKDRSGRQDPVSIDLLVKALVKTGVSISKRLAIAEESPDSKSKPKRDGPLSRSSMFSHGRSGAVRRAGRLRAGPRRPRERAPPPLRRSRSRPPSAAAFHLSAAAHRPAEPR